MGGVMVVPNAAEMSNKRRTEGPRILWARGPWRPWHEQLVEQQGQKSRLEGRRDSGRWGSRRSGCWHMYQEVLLCLKVCTFCLFWFRPVNRQTHYNVHIALVRHKWIHKIPDPSLNVIYSMHPLVGIMAAGNLNECLVGLVLLSPHPIITSGKVFHTRPTSPAIIIKERNVWST